MSSAAFYCRWGTKLGKIVLVRPCSSSSPPPLLPAALCQPRIPKDRKERRASAIRERIVAGLAIVDDESLDRHGLHCVRGDANGGRADAGCGAEQDHALLCGERRRHLCHGYSRRQLLANAAIAASPVLLAGL